MTFTIPAAAFWFVAGGALGSASTFVVMFRLGLRYNRRQAAKAKADAVQAVTARHGHGTGT